MRLWFRLSLGIGLWSEVGSEMTFRRPKVLLPPSPHPTPAQAWQWLLLTLWIVTSSIHVAPTACLLGLVPKQITTLPPGAYLLVEETDNTAYK